MSFQYDVKNCGACGHECTDGRICTSGVCKCPSNWGRCVGTCIDFYNDPKNCGGCGNECTNGKICTSGSCVCPATWSTCNGICTDLQSDPDNCAGCGNECTNGKICKSGNCQCAFGSSVCNGQCIDTQNDAANCGGCGNACAGSLECVAGQCGCHTGKTDCSDVCIDTTSDDANCGACGSACASGKSCVGGACVSPSCVLFSETFADNSQGWTLGSTWEIGAATASTGQSIGFPDPGTDHSAGSDNGVAGVVIGGNAPTSGHPAYYLVSPVIDTTTATSGVRLLFQRWLNSRAATVEVFDGTGWSLLWSLSVETTDSSWVPQSFLLTPYSNAKLQVRFGYIFNPYSQVVSGWNIDDVQVLKLGCN
jgi:hypothetical protein